MDSNHRPHPCQGCALTRLSYGPTGWLRFNSTGWRVIRATLVGDLRFSYGGAMQEAHLVIPHSQFTSPGFLIASIT